MFDVLRKIFGMLAGKGRHAGQLGAGQFVASRANLKKGCLAGCFCAIAFVTATAFTQDQPKDLLPDAPGKDTVVSQCTQCHDETRFATLRKSRDDWDQVITQMSSNGLTLTDEQYGIILDYLTKNLGPVPATTKVNVNQASAADLVKALQISDDEAAAIVKYRTDHGNFKDWHDVASVVGVDPAKIEAKKDLLTF